MVRKVPGVPVWAGDFVGHGILINVFEKNGAFGIETEFKSRAAAVPDVERKYCR